MKTANRVIFFSTAFALLVIMSVIPPKRYGDGWEYYLMTESLFNHMGPGLRDSDISSILVLQNKFGLDFSAPQGYYTAPDQSSYSYHFWAYPLGQMDAE